MAIGNGTEWLIRILLSAFTMALGVIFTLIIQITTDDKTVVANVAQNATDTAVLAQRTLTLENAFLKFERELTAINVKLDNLPDRIRP